MREREKGERQRERERNYLKNILLLFIIYYVINIGHINTNFERTTMSCDRL